MLRTATLVGLAALAPLLPFQGSDETAPTEVQQISLRPSWEVGDSYRLEFTKTRARSQGKREGEEMGTVTPVDVLVHGADDEGYSVRWKLGQAEFVGIDPEEMGPVADLAAMFQGVELDMHTNALGVPDKLLNEEQVRKHVNELFDRIEELALADGAPPALIKQMLNPARGMVEGELLSGFLLREPGLFYFPCGLQLNVGEAVESEELIPNPFGGDPLPATSRLLLESLDTENGRAVVRHRLELGQGEETERILRETFTRIAKQMGGPAPRPESLPEMLIVDETEYDVDVATGLPRSMSYARTTSTAGTTQVDRVAIRVLPTEEEE
ncbi:MAG: hypothetical protein H6831_05925 [Planctomycetes bacterium]|nr:hypothetical protein [Planctomycetota bacterium]MCB9903929.1 hypothetical protein [Planctomycetota bacterium]